MKTLSLMGVGVQSLMFFVPNEYADASIISVLDGCFTVLGFKFKFEIKRVL